MALAEGLRLLRSGSFAAAAQFAREKRSLDVARLTLLEAEALIEGGQAADALKLLEASVASTVEYRIRRLILTARVAWTRGELDRAAEIAGQARAAAKQAQREDLDLEATLLEAQIAGRRKLLPQAQAILMESRKRAQAIGEKYREGVAVNGLGMVQLSFGHFDDAIPLFDEAKRLWNAAGAKHWETIAANNLASCYTQLGDFERAQQLREEALRVAQPGILKANALGETGTTFLLQQQPDKAVPYYRQARDMAQQAGLPVDAARWASNLTAALVTLEDWPGAEQALQSALALKPEARSRVFLDLNAAAIARGRGRHEEARERYRSILAAHPEQTTVLWQAEAGIANSYVAQQNYPEARQHFEAALAYIESGRTDLKLIEHRLTFLARLIRVYQDYVDFLVGQNDSRKALEIAESSRARLLAERTASNFRAPKGRLELPRSTGAVWLVYWVAPRRSFLWIVHAGAARLVELPGEAELAQSVEAYRALIETSMRDPLRELNEAGRRLYEVLIAPAAKELAARPAAIVVPDGPLHQLSFETLPNYASTPWRFWNDEVTAAVSPSLNVSASIERTAPRGAAALLLGDPEAATAEYPALAQAARELDSIARLWPGAKVVRGRDATPELWKSLTPKSYLLIHIAAHAEANRRSPLDSAIILSRGAKGDFRLFAREVLAKSLPADLVTLSACKSSGSRTYAGEGQVGLAWAFLSAGARTTVAGLWDVPDASTALLMEKFYQGMSEGQPPALALRRARIAVREAGFVKPFYWGPFQCYLR